MIEKIRLAEKSFHNASMTWIGVTLLLGVLMVVLAWVSSGFIVVQQWPSFLGVGLLSVLMLMGSWWIIKSDSKVTTPNWFLWLMVGAIILRLTAGAFWYLALPRFGYGTPPEMSGYVMADAYDRDQAAWKLASSGKPLIRAFSDQQKSDQYGGMLYISALIYRYFGGETHAPLLMIVVTATISTLALVFVWAFAYRIWDEKIAVIAVVLAAIIPEAVLLGSAQMREAFTMTLAMATLYGLVRYLQDHTWLGLGLMVGGLFFCALISPPFLVVLIVVTIIIALSLSDWSLLHRRWFWLALFGFIILAVLGLWLTWGKIAPDGVSNPIALIGWWLRKSADWQAYLSERGSGWIQKIFRSTPEWMHIPFLVVYGIVQPFLPAAVISTGIPIWKGIAIWRAIGWTFLLGFLTYVPFRTFQHTRKDKLILPLSLVVWVMIIISSFRGGGDEWDNPRYRAAFLGLQVLVVAWVIVKYWRKKDPWLVRALVSFGILIAWFVPWYLRRYTTLNWPIEDLFKTVGLGIVCIVLYIMWDIIRKYKVV